VPCGSGKKFKFCCERSTSEDTVETLCQRATDFPVAVCRAAPGWEEGGLAAIVVARRTPDQRYLAASYLVDTLCLGLKETFVQRIHDQPDFAGGHGASLEEMAYEDARSLILGAVEYARQWGFEPDPDWSLSSSIIEADRPFKRKFTFGKDGKPVYVAGPNDDTPRILRTLEPLLKANQAEYVVLDEDESLEDTESVDADDTVFESLCAEAEAHLKAERPKQAQPAIDKLLMEYPNDWEPFFFQATALAMTGNPEAAIPAFERAAKIKPSGLIYFNLAVTHRQLFALREYLDCLDTVIALNDNPDVTAAAKSELSEFAEGIKNSDGLTLDQFRRGHDDFDNAFECLRKGKLNEAAEGFQKVLAIQPNHVQSHGNLGLVFAALGDREEALLHLGRAIELDPNYTPAVQNRRAVLNTPTGKRLDLGRVARVDFYPDQAKSKWPIRKAKPVRDRQS
jgi:tetratricopeptide (TPR) repeat protein